VSQQPAQQPRLREGRRTTMGVFKKQGVSWIDFYVGGHQK
jgi:hypothetical protein